MFKMIGKILLTLGLLMVTGTVIWGWSSKIFDSSQSGAGIGLTRIFFLFMYFPISVSIATIGLFLAFRDFMAKSSLVKMSTRFVSILLLLFAVGFVASNVINNIKHYGGEGLSGVLIQNFMFSSPIFFLSGLFFFLSRITSKGS
jgi:glucan phosphoethanolaminetransferase (alkaline phosphatase superfamily)